MAITTGGVFECSKVTHGFSMLMTWFGQSKVHANEGPAYSYTVQPSLQGRASLVVITMAAMIRRGSQALSVPPANKAHQERISRAPVRSSGGIAAMLTCADTEALPSPIATISTLSLKLAGHAFA